MKRYAITTAALLLGLLAGCANEQAVHIGAYRQDFAPTGATTYALLPSGLVATVPQAWLVPSLAAAGLRQADMADAQYLLSAAYATRPETLGVRAECSVAAPHACTEPVAPRTWFSGKRFVHTLTIQLMARTSGAIHYRVMASKINRNPDGGPILHGLIVCALQGFPLANGAYRQVAHCD